MRWGRGVEGESDGEEEGDVDFDIDVDRRGFSGRRRGDRTILGIY